MRKFLVAVVEKDWRDPLAMTRLLVIGLAVLSLAMQESRHDKYKDDAHAYCWNPRSSGSQVTRRERDPHAHKCACHLMCQIGADGNVTGDQEDGTCELYCTRTRCTCHVESPCEMPHSGGASSSGAQTS